MIDTAFLKAFTEVPSIGTACLPAMNMLVERFGSGYDHTFVSDGFCLFQKAGARPEALKVVFVAHVDEVGGCVYGPYGDHGFLTRAWGNTPDLFAGFPLQAFDYLTPTGADAFPVRGEVEEVNGEDRMVLYGEGIRPYRTGWTFLQETTFDGDIIDGKALDPRVTAYAVIEAVMALNSPEVGALFVMAEECAMDVARKAVIFLQERAPALQLIANADVPGIQNIGEGRLELPAIRIFEGRNFIDPMFGIRVAEVMEQQGVDFHLSAARSGSQTLLFSPLAPTLSIALPSKGVHLPRVLMSLQGTERCITLLHAIGASALDGKLTFSPLG
ncbi:MAG: cellulase (putative endo glucanase) Aminopeptidase [Chthonomonadales bacterium]|nr:cellulase (putative endo glucanase) Aminopeptidase [Chthonomonadales bacterium]